MEIWDTGLVKTTIELPDELFRRVKMRAASRNEKLKDTVRQLLESGLRNAIETETTKDAPKPVRLKEGRPITIDDIEAAISSGRD